MALHWQILIAIVLAAIAGSLSRTEAGIGPLTFHGVYEFIGTLFIRALKMIIVPLIFVALLFGFSIAGVGDEHAEPLFNFWNVVFQVMMKIIEFIMRFAPIGVFGLVSALVTSIGVASVPSASMVAIGMILTAVGIPVAAMGLLFVFDRVLDMLRTRVNELGDGATVLVVARMQGEHTLLASPAPARRA